MNPRCTRLVRVPDLHAFRHALVQLSCRGGPDTFNDRLVVVPTQASARQLRRTAGRAPLPPCVTRDELYDTLAGRHVGAPPRLTRPERDVIMESAARYVSGTLDASMNISPGIVGELVIFYDQLRRHGRNVRRFEELVELALHDDLEHDRGAARMMGAARFLAGTFSEYERYVARLNVCDEHALRSFVLAGQAAQPIRAVVVAVGDWIADPDGLFLADFDLLTRLPGLEAIDVIATERGLAAGFHRRVHDWLPGIDEVDAASLDLEIPARRAPVLVVPSLDADPPLFVVRDRAEEVIAIARRAARDTAVVCKRPLPYLYQAREIFGSARIRYESANALPLATEPYAAAVDLVLAFVQSDFTRESLVALLRSPYLVNAPERLAVAALDRELSASRYLGGLDRLTGLASGMQDGDAAAGAAASAVAAAEPLAPLLEPAPASTQFARLRSFVEERLGPAVVESPREVLGRAAVLATLATIEQAYLKHGDVPLAIDDVARVFRRNIEDQTFAPPTAETGTETGIVQLVDDQAARFGDFEEIAIVGLVETDWSERARRNVFFPPSLLTNLGWPSEQERRAASEARFVDLLESASRQVSVSTITLDDETLAEPSTLADEIAGARLSHVTLTVEPRPIFDEDYLSAEPVDVGALFPASREWAELRLSRSSPDAAVFHGQALPAADRSWSVTALETYLGCPFKFFAQHVLALAEEPEDEEVMDPRREGQFVHEVFEAFFERWQLDGHQSITSANLDAARAVFGSVVDERLSALGAAEAALQRTRLLGSPAAAGLGDAVLRMEAERLVPVVGRLLEHRLEGSFVFETADGPRAVSLRSKADRIDLLADGTFRVIDYKLGWPPNKARALQLPIYGVCAEQRLVDCDGRQRVLSEAMYVAFKGPRRIVPLFGSPQERGRALADAQERLIAAVDGIGRGEFPPRPDDVHRCESCSFAAVCRKDYVGDV